MDLVSIIMPAYNAEKFISDSINSVLKQTYTNWELLIINDGSIDSTIQITENYKATDARIKVFNQENKKQAGARNTGIKQSTGYWIAFLDADDIWDERMLEKQIETSKKYPLVDVIYTDGWIFNNNDFQNLFPYLTITGKIIEYKEMYNLEYLYNHIPVLSVIVRKSLIDKIGLQDEERVFCGCEDWDYWLRMAKAGSIFYGIPEKLFFYRRHGNNMSDNYTKMLLAQVAVFIKNYQPNLFYKKKPIVLLEKQVFSLLKILIRKKKFEDVRYVLRNMETLSFSYFYRLIRVLIKFMGEYAYFPVAAIGKFKLIIDSII